MKEFFQMMRRFVSPYKKHPFRYLQRVFLLSAHPDTEHPVQDRRGRQGIFFHGMGKRRHQRRGGQ